MKMLSLSVLLAAVALSPAVAGAQTPHVAPANAPSSGRVAPNGEPGTPLSVSGVVVGSDGSPVANASIFVYQTDREGYYGVKPASDNRNPRLKLFLRSDAKGAWAFDTIRPGSYPASRVPGHIHFEVAADGFAPTIYEIVFEGDPFITDDMRKNPAFAVRPVTGGKVTDRIVLAR